MSDQFDPGMAGGRQPTEEEIRAALAELRAAPLDDIVAQAISLLLNAVQVKIGRQDARVLIDSIEAIMDKSGAHVDQRLTAEVENVLGQLRMAQVEAEQEIARAGESEAGDVGQPADQPTGQAPPSAPGGPEQPPSQGSRLWVPGQ